MTDEGRIVQNFNEPLARRVLDHIREHPETWQQSTWRCGTSACFAGLAAELDGAHWSWPWPARNGNTLYLVYAPPNRDDVLADIQRCSWCSSSDEPPADRTVRDVPVDQYAAHALGLHHDGSNLRAYYNADLFASENTLVELEEIVDRFSFGREDDEESGDE